MRTQVTFRTFKFSMTDPIPSAKPFDQDLGGDCTLWLIEQLPKHGVATDEEPCQEDWGWELFATRDGVRFWIGVSPLFSQDDPPDWIAHLHHWDFNLLKRFTKRGRAAKEFVAAALDTVLRESSDISEVRWHHERDVMKHNFDAWADSPTAP